MMFCKYCGNKNDDDARFCTKCGKELINVSHQKTEAMRNCPNCGSPISSLAVTCIFCGSEIDANSGSAAVENFKAQLEAIDNRDDGVLSSIGDALKYSWDRRASKKTMEKAALIRNFPIPSSKKDLFELLLFSISNINAETALPALISSYFTREGDLCVVIADGYDESLEETVISCRIYRYLCDNVIFSLYRYRIYICTIAKKNKLPLIHNCI